MGGVISAENLTRGVEGVFGQYRGRAIIVPIITISIGFIGVYRRILALVFEVEGRGNEHLGSSAKMLEVAYQYAMPPARAHLTIADLKLDFFGAAVLRGLAVFVKAGWANEGRNGEWRRRALPAGRNIFVCGENKIGGTRLSKRGNIYRLFDGKTETELPLWDELKNFLWLVEFLSTSHVMIVDKMRLNLITISVYVGTAGWIRN